MSLPFVHRPPTAAEFQCLRLILSTYQDGTGQLRSPVKSKLTAPGWRDFERSVALAMGGEAQESKAIFDVLVPALDRPGVFYGLSCKMRRLLSQVVKTARVTIEVSNSSGKFWNAIKAKGLDETSYDERPAQAGQALIDTVHSWYNLVNLGRGGNIDLEKSCYLVLQWNKRLQYQLFQFPLALPDPAYLSWRVDSRRLIGEDSMGILIEWYGFAGGQLKYYPRVQDAVWKSEVFELEPLPENARYGILFKAENYFPALWKQVAQ